MSKRLLSGNEAIAQGAWEAGCSFGFGYPGTPSTETLQAFGKLDDVYAEWATNEKVALETAIGASMAGVRSLVTMKHVGLNVAADPLLTLAYTGVYGGIVILAADDPGMFSSQNEQDSRNYASFARMPMFEPSNSSEALEMTKAAFDLSEEFDTAVLLRSTVRISHTKNMVETAERKALKRIPYEKNARKWVMAPANATYMRPIADQRVRKLVGWVNKSPWNRMEIRDTKVGFICSGAVYNHVREACPEASILKLGLSYPLPDELIAKFFDTVETVYIVEEANDYYDVHIRALGFLPSTWPNGLPEAFELSPSKIKQALGIETEKHIEIQDDVPNRPPTLCPGCPHRLMFAELRRLKAIVTGDIGCYTLAAGEPLKAMDSTIDMGASISMAHGFTLAQDPDDNRMVVGIIGDGTFTHSGVTSLMSMVYNAGVGNIVILDNRTTAMTGGQGNPINGVTLQGRPSRELDLVPFLRAMGIEDVVEVDAQSQEEVKKALKNAKKNSDQLSVIVAKAPCALEFKIVDTHRIVDNDACHACGVCISIGCPALSRNDETKAFINQTICVGCGQCEQVCPFDCIAPIDN